MMETVTMMWRIPVDLKTIKADFKLSVRLQLASGAPKLLSIVYSVSMALLDTGITSVLFVFFFA